MQFFIYSIHITYMLYTQYIFFVIEMRLFSADNFCADLSHMLTHMLSVFKYTRCYKVVLRKVPEVVISRPIK